MNLAQIRQRTAYNPNAIPTQKVATRKWLNSLHKQYPFSLTLTLKNYLEIKNPNGVYYKKIDKHDIRKIAKSLNPERPISQKEQMLKLANEVERYPQTSMWGYNIIDILHSVRRAQAINSNIKSAGLKYITQYLEIQDEDRVYIDHTEIGPMYAKKEDYWLNDKNGKYKKADNPQFDDLDIRFPGTYI